MKHEISLPPRYFGPGLRRHLENRLYQEVEGVCNGRYGYIVSVVSIDRVDRGMIEDTFGSANFTLFYKAVIFKPFKNEVVDAVVTSVNQMGFFADVAALPVFVSTEQMPADMAFDASAANPSFVSADRDIVISKDDQVRLKILGLRIDATEIVSGCCGCCSCCGWGFKSFYYSSLPLVL